MLNVEVNSSVSGCKVQSEWAKHTRRYSRWAYTVQRGKHFPRTEGSLFQR